MSRSMGLQTLNANLPWRRLIWTASNRVSLCVALGIIATALMLANAKAQDAEPRSYTNTPVGLNFLIAGYLYSQGKIAFDPSSSITDAQFHSHTGVLAYVRSLAFWVNPPSSM